MAPSSDVNNTDEDESKKFIVHEPFDEPSSENLCMDVSESECNIVNEILSHKWLQQNQRVRKFHKIPYVKRIPKHEPTSS